jgi:hypothetical protein
MKRTGFILSFFVLTSLNILAQTDTSYITGIVKQVKPHFGGQQTLVVNGQELVLISDPKDPTGNTFEINSPFNDILVKKDGAFVLNPKYKNLAIKFGYTVNGKGWKCIANANWMRPKKALSCSGSTSK